jgi:hypothetical protein
MTPAALQPPVAEVHDVMVTSARSSGLFLKEGRVVSVGSNVPGGLLVDVLAEVVADGEGEEEHPACVAQIVSAAAARTLFLPAINRIYWAYVAIPTIGLLSGWPPMEPKKVASP